jgi:tetratricopeptide (TPR) repeat protein
MRILPVNLKRIVAALGCGLWLSGVAVAEPAPAELFERLRNATGAEATRIEHEIETHWKRSGSAAMDLLYKRGQDALDLEQVALAIDHLTALTDHAPDFAAGWHLRAQAYYRKGLLGPALADLERTLALDPQNYNAIFGLAVMLQDIGKTRQAATLYRRVLEINPHHQHAQPALDALQRDGVGRTL